MDSGQAGDSSCVRSKCDTGTMMMNNVADWLVQNREGIEKGVAFIGQVAAVLAPTVGQLHPVLKAVFKVSSQVLGNPEGKEANYLTEQLKNVTLNLKGIQNQADNIALALTKAGINMENAQWEEKLLSQYEKFEDFMNASPKFKGIKKEMFTTQFEKTKKELSLNALYSAVTGENSGNPLLEMVVTIERRNRRNMENFCAQLKKLFIVGIIVVLGYAALTQKVVDEEVLEKWQQRMEDVEKHMNAAVDDCIENFAMQAEDDIKQYLQENPGSVDPEFAKSLLDVLVKKYDWVNWSIRLFNKKESFFVYEWLAGKNFNGSGGANWFEILTGSNVKVVISFCVNPKPINKSQIVEQIEKQKLRSDKKQVAESLHNSIPDCLVHASSYYKKVEETHNFQEECYYHGLHQKTYLCVHPE